MVAPSQLAQLQEQFSAAGQGHVFTYFTSLSPSEQNNLLEQLQSIGNVERVNTIYRQTMANVQSNDYDLSPISNVFYKCSNKGTSRKRTEESLRWEELGFKLIADGHTAVLTLAGGQGTRLGSSAPKGCYNIGLPSGKSLFQLQAERILSLQNISAAKSGKSSLEIFWYLMTSGPTHNETVSFFKSNNFFGLSEHQIIFFQQGVLPCLTFEGAIIMESKGKVGMAPDGNGGIYAALERQAILQHMKQHSIKYVHVYCVDNCLVKVGDPTFFGVCVEQGADCGIKTVLKTSPHEPVGVLCKNKGKVQVIEYSEIDKSTAELVIDDQLAYCHANIANHIFSVTFLEEIVKNIEPKMPYHIARKKIPTIDTNGNPIKPSSPNGMKLELFVFDVLPYARNLTVYSVPREEEFSPLKNAPGSGEDCPETSVCDIMNQHKRYLSNAGAEIEDIENAVVEISPIVSYDGEGLMCVSGKMLKSPIILNTRADFEKF